MSDSLGSRAGPRSLLKLVLALAMLLVGIPGLSHGQSDLTATTLHAQPFDIGDPVASPVLTVDFDATLNVTASADAPVVVLSSDPPTPVRDTGSGGSVAALDCNVPNLGHLMRHQPTNDPPLRRHFMLDVDNQPLDLRSARVLPLRT